MHLPSAHLICISIQPRLANSLKKHCSLWSVSSVDHHVLKVGLSSAWILKPREWILPKPDPSPTPCFITSFVLHLVLGFLLGFFICYSCTVELKWFILCQKGIWTWNALGSYSSFLLGFRLPACRKINKRYKKYCGKSFLSFILCIL